MRNKPLLSDEQCSAVHREIAAAERRTSAEILPAVARASGRYDRAEDVVGLWFGLLLCAAIWYFFQGVGASGGWSSILEVRMGFWAVAVAVVLGFIVGVIVGGRVHWLRRLFTSNLEMEQEVLGRAKAVFHDCRVHRTSEASGVLIFVSLYERRAAILADEKIVSKLGERSLQEVRDELIDGIGKEDVETGLCRAIARLGSFLEIVLPRGEKDHDEVYNEVVLLD